MMQCYLTKKAGLLCSVLLLALCVQAQTPELLYYRFDSAGTSVNNLASSPPAGTATATIMGAVTQGGTSGSCGTGALIGTGNSSSTDYLNTNWATNVSGSWSIVFYTSNFTSSSTLFYIFGDVNAGSFRCFTNGVAGASNWVLRGPLTDVYINGGATVAPHMCAYVYDEPAGYIYAYLDGVLVTSVAQSPISISGTGPFKVMGYSTNVGAPAGGKIDDFRFYNHALTAAEVTSLNDNYNYWLGYSQDWNDGANWCGGSPVASGDVIIPASGSVPFMPHIFSGNTGDVNSILMQGGTLNVDAGGTLNLNGNLSVSPSGTIDATGGTIILNGGSQLLNIGFNTSVLTVQGAGDKQLNVPVTVTGNLGLTGGRLVLNTDDLVMSPGAALSGGSATSYVQTSGAGTELVREVGAGTGIVPFPVGSSSYNPAYITNAGTTDNFRVHVRDEVLDGGSTGSAVNSFTTYDVNRSWDIEEDIAGGSDAAVTLQWNGGEENNALFDYSHVFVSHYYAGSWHHDGYAYASAAPAAAGSNPYTATLGGISSFSPFTVGSAGGATPLPVQLIQVNALNEGAHNKISWNSASEAGLMSYEVQRSADGQNFTKLSAVAPAGHASGYIVYDDPAAAGFTWYRIRLIHADGSVQYSNTVQAFRKAGSDIVLTVAPNPAKDILYVSAAGASSSATIKVTDLSGRLISQWTLEDGRLEIPVSDMLPGMYLINFRDNDIHQTIRFNKQ